MIKKVAKKSVNKVINILREKKGGGIVSTIIIIVMLAIISVGVFTAVKPEVKTTEKKTVEMLQSAGDEFEYK